MTTLSNFRIFLEAIYRGYIEIKLFQNYFTGLLSLMNIFQHVQCRRNKFEIFSAAEIILFQSQTWLYVKQNYFEISFKLFHNALFHM